MFKLSKKTSYEWPVVVTEPKAGAFYEQRFTAEFKLLPQTRIAELTQTNDDSSVDNTAQLVREMLVGWKDIVDDEGVPVPYSEDVKETMIDTLYVRMGIVSAFFKSIAGRLPKT